MMIFLQRCLIMSWHVLAILIFTNICLAGVKAQTKDPADDPHGGVPMGQSNDFCDNGKVNTDLDWDPSSTEDYTCTGEIHEMPTRPKKYFHCDQTSKRPVHICYPQIITYTEDLPTSGPHRPLWPKYGEYTYLPVQRWLHSLEHGAVVFLYHPCAAPDQIEMFKSVARGCLRRHIISPYKKLPPDMNFALLTWKCKALLTEVDVPFMVEFIKSRAKNAPEGQVYQDGQYDLELIRPAEKVTDMKDSDLCPKMSAMTQTSQDIKERSNIRKAEAEQSENRLKLIVAKLMDEFEE